METPTVTTASPAVPNGDAETKTCSTDDVLEKLKRDLAKAQLDKDIASQKAAALDAHLKQLQTYDDKINAAADAYRKGIDAVCADFDELRKAVEKNTTQYQCLVCDDEKTKVAQIFADLQRRRETLEQCTWTLSQRVIDITSKLAHGTAEIAREDKALNDLLGQLARETKEITDLKALKETIDCSDTVSKQCRYAFYLDLVERLKIDCPTADEYKCELVDQITALDKKRQAVAAIEEGARVLQDQLDRVTKLRDDLVANWDAQLCSAVTAGAVPTLPDGIGAACGETAKPPAGTGTSAGGQAGSTEQQAGGKPDGGHESPPEAPPQAQGA